MALAPAARVALLQALTRGRDIPTTLQTRPAVGRMGHQTTAAFRGLQVEELQMCSETEAELATDSACEAAQAWVPVRLVKQAVAQGRLPVVVLLHATGTDKDSLATQQAHFARRGYLAAAIDCRYHGDRAAVGEGCWEGYQQALVRAWRGSGELPFLLDNVWDLLRLLDLLQSRPDVEPGRIGMTGVSLGGMHTWLTAAADERVAAAAPMIGVQNFGWAVEQQRYHARVGSIPHVFQAAAAEAIEQLDPELPHQAPQAAGGEAQISADVVKAVWDRLLPGLLEHYDAPMSLPLLAPRPLLIANGELDPRCPMEGVHLAMEAVQAAYERQGSLDKLQLYVVPDCEHQSTDCMWEQVFAFMDRHLLQRTS
ncbi:hypothetical protein D9Q98_004649 [Chlorella vulgaris]|uniref:Dienelactone hydrolase domain-containing protein n=1 Tax=Chlorella vulgaris TaxID=3077 RepID=A0A9D4YY48_CHLVU|nr:hypothetical protein D9Q98_004649 [Chlorella vulgaris]